MCQKKGHHARCCIIKIVHDVTGYNDESQNSEHFLVAVDDNDAKSWMKQVRASKHRLPVRFKLDSGDVSIILKKKLCASMDMKPSDKPLIGADNASINVLEYCNATLSIGNCEIHEYAYRM